MMAQELNRNYLFLDTEADRQRLIDEIATVRKAVLRVVNIVPPTQWYEPRYHNWSLAAMLGHLHLTDNLAVFNIQIGLMGLSLPISSSAWDGFNNFTTRLFRQRVVETTVRGIEKNERRIADFINRMPVGKFSKRVYYPPFNKYLTVEQSLQEYFLYHWQEHLKTMHEVEDIYYEPPEQPNVV